MTWLLQTTVYMTVTALFILGFKRVFKNRLPAKWHVYIWALLLVRLLIPSLPESRVSVYNAMPAVEYARPTVQTAAPKPAWADVHMAVPADVTAMTEAGTPSAAPAPAAPQISAEEIVTVIYIAGAVMLLSWFVLTYLLHLRKIMKYSPVADPEILELLRERKDRLKVGRNVALLSGGDTPSLVGFIRPKIVLPAGYSYAETRYVLTHELCHLKNCDTGILWLAMLVLCLNWFNPVLWYAFFTLRRDIEVYCDQRILELGEDKKEYAGLLLRTALRKNRFVFGTTALQNGEKEVERRIKYMAYFKKPKLIVSIVILLAAAVVAAACLTNAHRDEPDMADYAKVPDAVAAVTMDSSIYLDEALTRPIYELKEGDLLQIIENAGGVCYVQLPIMDIPPVCGFVSADVLTYEPKAVDSGNYGRIRKAAVYNSIDTGDVYSAEESGIIHVNYYSGDFANCDLIGGTDGVWVLRSDISRDITNDDTLYARTLLYLNRESYRVFSPYYDILNLYITDWQQTGSEAIFSYSMNFQYYNRDPETVEWLIQERERDPEGHQRRVEDYLKPIESNFGELKVVEENGALRIYVNEVEWKDEPIWHLLNMDAYVLGQKPETEDERPSVPDRKWSIENYFDFTFAERYDDKKDMDFSLTLPKEKDDPIVLYDRFSYDTSVYKRYASGGKKYVYRSENDGLTAYDSNKYLCILNGGTFLALETDYYEPDDREYVSCVRTNAAGAATYRGIAVGSSQDELLAAYTEDVYYLTKEQTEMYPIENEPAFDFDHAIVWQPFTPETNDTRDITFYIRNGKVSVIEVMQPYELRYVYGGRTDIIRYTAQ